MENKLIGVILLNLGGPDSLSAVRPFLYNLFSDREIIRLGPPFLQRPLAWLISTLRSGKTEAMYKQIGGKSPILDITAAQAEALQKTLNQSNGSKPKFKVYIGMRYWHPFMEETMNKILRDEIRDLIVLSLYPHYSKATTGSSVADFKRAAAKLHASGSGLRIQYIEQWYDFPPYIDALADLIAQDMHELDQNDLDILYSAHSLPQSFIDEGDPYLEHIKNTVEKVNRRLSEEPYGLKPARSHLSFQSKSGPVKWLEPATEDMIIRLAGEGRKHIIVVPVSFVSDHIETLYEIDIQYRELAEKHGMNLRRCRALNTSDKFIKALKDLVITKTAKNQ